MTMISESTALRIAQALERLAAAVEAGQKPAIRQTTAAAQPFICYRCIPAHVLDWGNPCKSHQGALGALNIHDTASYY